MKTFKTIFGLTLFTTLISCNNVSQPENNANQPENNVSQIPENSIYQKGDIVYKIYRDVEYDGKSIKCPFDFIYRAKLKTLIVINYGDEKSGGYDIQEIKKNIIYKNIEGDMYINDGEDIFISKISSIAYVGKEEFHILEIVNY